MNRPRSPSLPQPEGVTPLTVKGAPPGAPATITYLRGRKDSNGKTGCVGFCWGGAAVNNLAHARQIFTETLVYVKERQAFGQPIGSFQSNKFRLAELVTSCDVAQSFVDACVLELVGRTLLAIGYVALSLLGAVLSLGGLYRETHQRSRTLAETMTGGSAKAGHEARWSPLAPTIPG